MIYISKNHPFAFYLPVLNPRAARADRAKCNRKICAPTYLPYGPPPALTPSARPYVLFLLAVLTVVHLEEFCSENQSFSAIWSSDPVRSFLIYCSLDLRAGLELIFVSVLKLFSTIFCI